MIGLVCFRNPMKTLAPDKLKKNSSNEASEVAFPCTQLNPDDPAMIAELDRLPNLVIDGTHYEDILNFEIPIKSKVSSIDSLFNSSESMPSSISNEEVFAFLDRHLLAPL